MNKLLSHLIFWSVLLYSMWNTQFSFASPAPCISWQLQSDNWENLQQAIPKAKEMGASRIQLSHHLIMKAEDLKHNLGIIRKAIQLAHKHSLAVDLWTHELSFENNRIPEHRSWSRIEEELKHKYQELFRTLPDIDGLVLTLAESQVKVYGDKITQICHDLRQTPPQERISRLIAVIAKICTKAKKQLIVRTFVYTPRETRLMTNAIQNLQTRLSKEEMDNLIVMCKCVPHDWHPYYPFSNDIGQFHRFKEWVEIDLGEEFTGQNLIPYSEVDYIRHITDFSRRRVCGYVARVERFDNSIFGTLNEVNLFALHQFAKGPHKSQDVWEMWADKHYRPGASHLVISALSRTAQIVNRLFFPLQEWVSNHSQLPSIPYVHSSLRKQSVAKWIRSSFYRSSNEKLLEPDLETLEEIQHEKQRAALLVQRSLEDIEKAKPYLTHAQYTELHEGLKLEQELLEVFGQHQRAVFALSLAQRRGRDFYKGLLIAKEASRTLKMLNSDRVKNYLRTAYPRPENEDPLSERVKEIDNMISEWGRLYP